MSSSTTFRLIKSEIKNNLSLSIPLVASQLVYACSGFVGTAFVARLGEDALAASVLISTIWMTLSVLFFGLLNSISVLIAHQYGAKNEKAISEIMGQSFLLGIIVCVLIILLLLTIPLFLPKVIQSPIVIKLSIEYMISLVWTIPGLVLLIIYEQFLAGINRAKFVLRISLLVVPIEIPIIYALIFGVGGLPKLGIAGVGYGFTVTYTLTAIFLTFYFLRSKFYRHFKIFHAINQIHIPYLLELIRIGLPMGFMHVIEVSTFTVATFWMAKFGITMLAAHQIIMQYLGFGITLVFAMSQAVTVRVGHAVGKLDLQSIYYASYVGMTINFILMLAIAIAFYLMPAFFLSIDIDTTLPANADLVRDGSKLLMICGILMLFDNFRIIEFGALRGLKDTKYPMYAAFIAFWLIGLPAAYILGFSFNFAGLGIWWGLTIGIASGSFILWLRLSRSLKRVNLNDLVQREDALLKQSIH